MQRREARRWRCGPLTLRAPKQSVCSERTIARPARRARVTRAPVKHARAPPGMGGRSTESAVWRTVHEGGASEAANRNAGYET